MYIDIHICKLCNVYIYVYNIPPILQLTTWTSGLLGVPPKASDVVQRDSPPQQRGAERRPRGSEPRGQRRRCRSYGDSRCMLKTPLQKRNIQMINLSCLNLILVCIIYLNCLLVDVSISWLGDGGESQPKMLSGRVFFRVGDGGLLFVPEGHGW